LAAGLLAQAGRIFSVRLAAAVTHCTTLRLLINRGMLLLLLPLKNQCSCRQFSDLVPLKNYCAAGSSPDASQFWTRQKKFVKVMLLSICYTLPHTLYSDRFSYSYIQILHPAIITGSSIIQL